MIISSQLAINAQDNEAIATKISVGGIPDSWSGGELKIIVDSKEIKISDMAKISLLINGGKDVIYSTRPGSGGFEDEGEAINIYNVKSKSTRKILSEYFMIDAVSIHKLSNGKTAVLVKMSDGGLGAEYIAVVDPTRGEVFFQGNSQISKVSGDMMTLAVYKHGEDMVLEGLSPTEAAAYKKKNPPQKKTFDLKEILKNEEVIFNEHTFNRYTFENEKLKRVKLYFWRANDVLEGHNFLLSTVYRYVNPKAPLRPTLAALFGEIKDDELGYGFSNPTFGMKFEGVVLRGETATVKFSQPKNQTNYGTLGSYIFLRSIEKTALQFPTVKKVKICAVGDTLFDAQMDEPFTKCSK